MNVEHLHNEALTTLISPDVRVPKDVLLAPGNMKYTSIFHTDELVRYNVQTNLSRREKPILELVHTRSSLMQRGIEANVVTWNDDFNTPVLRLKNHSPNNIVIRENTGVCNTIEFRSEPLTGYALEQELFTQIHPQKDDSWRMWEENGESVGIEFLVNPDITYEIARKPGTVFLNGQTNGDHGRSEVNTLLKESRGREETSLWIGELDSPLFIGNKLHGVIMTEVYSGEEQVGNHAPSILVRGGKTGKSPEEPNTIRLEMFAPSKGLSRAEYVRMQFYKA